MRALILLTIAVVFGIGSAFGQRREWDPAEWRQAQGWRTDWSTFILHPDSLTITGDRDRIPALDSPTFETIQSASRWLSDREPVAVVAINSDVRAYPIQIMMYHDVANDVVGGVPVVMTFCILCGSAMAYDRRVDGDTLDFRYAGALHNSNLVMYDRKTETLWGQVVGQGLIGKYAGERLPFIAAPVMSFKEFRQNHPRGRVLSRETGFDRDYGRGRLTDYDTSPPIARVFRRKVDQRLSAKERVLVIENDDDIVAVPYSALSERKVISTAVGGDEYVALWGPGTASIYSERTADGIDVGAAVAYSPVVNGRALRFRSAPEPNLFRDLGTQSTWTLAGKAIDGPLAGETLEPAVHGVHFWFVWAAYRPDTRVVRR
jgi:hypothetical protein